MANSLLGAAWKKMADNKVRKFNNEQRGLYSPLLKPVIYRLANEPDISLVVDGVQGPTAKSWSMNTEALARPA